MSSATSIERRPVQAQADNGFKPWHFFVLASLLMATVAVVMSRQATPEHLVFISLTIGAAGAAAAGFYRMLAPLAVEDTSAFREPLTERARASMEREKNLVLRSIKELEFDRAMGKVSAKDFDEMAARLRTRAIMLMKQLDDGDSGYRELIERELAARLGTKRAGQPVRAAAVTAPVEEAMPQAPPAATQATISERACAQCGTTNDPDAVFCKRCGVSLPAGKSSMGNGR